MPGQHRKIAIIGAGAVGGYYGARLAQHGHDVHFLLRSDYEAVKRDGWTIQSRDGDFRLNAAQVHAYQRPQDMPQADLVIVTLKTTSNAQFRPLIAPLLHQTTTILTLQNGLGNEEQLAELFGAHRILGGMAFVCINRMAPGVIHHLDHGMIRLGELNGGRSERAMGVAQLFASSKVPCEVLADLRAGRWTKLVWNIPFNGLGAVLDATTDLLIGHPSGLAMITELMREVIAAAAAQGIQMPADMIERQITYTRTMGAYRSSMQIDRREGRPLEFEAILGEPLRRAQKAGVHAPFLQMLYHLVCMVDGQTLPIVHDPASAR